MPPAISSFYFRHITAIDRFKNKTRGGSHNRLVSFPTWLGRKEWVLKEVSFLRIRLPWCSSRCRVPWRSHADVATGRDPDRGGLRIGQRLNDASRDSPHAEVLLAPVEDLARILLGHWGRPCFGVGIKVLVAVDQLGIALDQLGIAGGKLHLSRTCIADTVAFCQCPCWTLGTTRGSTASFSIAPGKISV